jgi:hypothetical protein
MRNKMKLSDKEGGLVKEIEDGTGQCGYIE